MTKKHDIYRELVNSNENSDEQHIFYKALRPIDIEEDKGGINITIPFVNVEKVIQNNSKIAFRVLKVLAYEENIMRIYIDFTQSSNRSQVPAKSPMLCDLPKQVPLSVTIIGDRWIISDPEGQTRFLISLKDYPVKKWSYLMAPYQPEFEAFCFPDGKTAVAFHTYDQFNDQVYSIGLGYIKKNRFVTSVLYGFTVKGNEAFFGAGEQFSRLNHCGKKLELKNDDAMGVNNSKSYKNVPFYCSTRKYGIFMHTSCHVTMSFAKISSNTVQGKIEEPCLDLFFIAENRFQDILYRYRQLTGFPPELPLWTYGVWMSRMTYFSAKEVETVVEKLCREKIPCDVIHLDTGWFREDWVCDWTFSKERFPDPAGFAKRMKKKSIRLTLWQTPNIGSDNPLVEEAIQNHYIAASHKNDISSSSDFSNQNNAGMIDFSNPEAVKWYQLKLKKLIDMGYSAIKTDFGENINMESCFKKIPAYKMHNLYALLYQKAAFDITRETTGEGVIWARAGWAGCQKYPVHWGGDSASNWSGMAGTLRGGLQLGLSGFGYWSHDVPGFHGVPDFMNSWPDEKLYVRWTQFGVFSSHLRYHGTSPREPYEYPGVLDIVRKWLYLRYSLIPYLVEEGKKVTKSGKPILQAMVFHNVDDPTVWHIDDQYYFGDSFLVAPVMNDDGVRDVYLPEGVWMDFWSGEKTTGPIWMKDYKSPLDTMPVFVKHKACVPLYPEEVLNTGQMNMGKVVHLNFDNTYLGLKRVLSYW